MNSKEIESLIEDDKDFVWHHLLQHKVLENSEPLIIKEAKGLIVKDIHGKEYLDATSGGVWCVNVGYGRESIIDAVAEQLKKMPYFAGKFGNIPSIRFAKKLISLLPSLSKVYFSNSGSEANEKAYKIIRQKAHLTKSGKYKILYRHRDYHGTTMGALSSTGQNERKADYGPFLEGFAEFPNACCYRCDFGRSYPNCEIDCAQSIEKVVQKEDPDTIGAVVVEPITAGGGVIPPVKEYYPMLQDICRKYDIDIIMDEVVCGFGRTGKMFGFQHYDIDPDIVTMAKGLASSYMPISVTAVKQKIFDSFLNDPEDTRAYFRDISTYGGCAAGAAAALENVDIIERENLCENSQKMGDYLMDQLLDLKDLNIVGDIRGKGLFVGIELVTDKEKKTPMPESSFGKIMGEIMGQGLLVGSTHRSIPEHNNTINLAPALIITKNEVDQIVKVLKKVLVENQIQ